MDPGSDLKMLLACDSDSLKLKQQLTDKLRYDIVILDGGCNDILLTNVKENVDRIVYNEANRAVYITQSGFGPHLLFNKFNGIRAMYCRSEQEV